jgi:hypothetical protein
MSALVRLVRLIFLRQLRANTNRHFSFAPHSKVGGIVSKCSRSIPILSASLAVRAYQYQVTPARETVIFFHSVAFLTVVSLPHARLSILAPSLTITALLLSSGSPGFCRLNILTASANPNGSAMREYLNAIGRIEGQGL